MLIVSGCLRYIFFHFTENEKGVSTVLLEKADGVGMGLTVSGGLDKGNKPKISNLRLSGIAAM